MENRAAHRPRGRRLLQQELWRKGIDAETVNEVIAEADLDEIAAATELAQRRLSATTGKTRLRCGVESVLSRASRI